jgi:hypothetical protein
MESEKVQDLLVTYIGSNHVDVSAVSKLVTTTYGLIIWSLLSRRLVVATTTKPNIGHLAPASEVAGRHTLPF